MSNVAYRRWWRAALVVLAALCAGCSWQEKPVELRPTRLMVVLPIEPAPGASQPEAGDEDGPRQPLPDDAGMAITGQVYAVLAEASTFRFVPDLTVSDVMKHADVRMAPNLFARAEIVGKEVHADAVIYGSVHRFRERVGTEYGATAPASVSFDLGLIDVASGKVLWQGSFNETQESLSANLFNWWMFWRAGPHWFSARELAGLGVEKLIGEMKRAVRD
jgi:hypothetical protein